MAKHVKEYLAWAGTTQPAEELSEEQQAQPQGEPSSGSIGTIEALTVVQKTPPPVVLGFNGYKHPNARDGFSNRRMADVECREEMEEGEVEYAFAS